MKQKIKKCLVVISSNLSQILKNKLEKSVEYTLVYMLCNFSELYTEWGQEPWYSVLKFNGTQRSLTISWEFCFTYVFKLLVFCNKYQ